MNSCNLAPHHTTVAALETQQHQRNSSNTADWPIVFAAHHMRAVCRQQLCTSWHAVHNLQRWSNSPPPSCQDSDELVPSTLTPLHMCTNSALFSACSREYTSGMAWGRLPFKAAPSNANLYKQAPSKQGNDLQPQDAHSDTQHLLAGLHSTAVMWATCKT